MLRVVLDKAGVTVTMTATAVEVAYKLLVGVKTAVMLSVPVGRELVVQSPYQRPVSPWCPDPVTVVA